MEAQMAVVDSDGNVADSFVLDLPWKSVLLAMLSKKERQECAGMAEEQIAAKVGDVFLTPETAGSLVIQRIAENPLETKWSRIQKAEAVKWLVQKSGSGGLWQDLCDEAKVKFRITGRQASDDYAWFLDCLFLKTMLDWYRARSVDGNVVKIVPVKPVEE